MRGRWKFFTALRMDTWLQCSFGLPYAWRIAILILNYLCWSQFHQACLWNDLQEQWVFKTIILRSQIPISLIQPTHWFEYVLVKRREPCFVCLYNTFNTTMIQWWHWCYNHGRVLCGTEPKKEIQESCETKLVASMSASLKDQNLTDPTNLPDKRSMWALP